MSDDAPGKSKELNILMLSPVPPEWGGISMGGMANVVVELSRHMVGRGCRLSIYAYNSLWKATSDRYRTLPNGINLISRLSPEMASPLFVARHYGFLNVLGAAIRMRKMKKKLVSYGLMDSREIHLAAGEIIYLSREVPEETDIIHMHIPNKSTIAVPFLKRKAPLIATVHKHHSPKKNKDRDGSDVERDASILRMALPHFDAITAVSHGIKKELIEMGADPDRVSVIPNGVDTDMFHPGDKVALRQKLGLPHDKTIVLFVGRLELIKGVDILVNAWERVQDLGRDAVLYIIGDGSQREQLEAQVAKKKLEGTVRFMGAVGHHELPQWYSAADIFCLPSRAEAFGIVLLEAMASGLPCIGPDISGVNELIVHGTNGLLHEPESSNSLADALLDLLGSEGKRWKMAAAAREGAMEYSWDRITDKLLALYRENIEA